MTAHNDRIDELCRDEGAYRVHFKRSLAGMLRRINPTADPHWAEETVSRVNFIPDAYKLSDDPPEVIIYEVESTHRIPAHKKASICDLWMALDCWEIELRLVVADIRGGRLEPDLSEWDYEVTSAAAASKYAAHDPDEPDA